MALSSGCWSGWWTTKWWTEPSWRNWFARSGRGGSDMLAHFADISVRVLALALIASIFAWRRSAAVQHAVWTTVAWCVLALFAFSSALPRLPLKVLHALPEQAFLKQVLPAPVTHFDLPAQGDAPTPIP